MSRNRNKKRLYRLELAANGAEPPTATLEVEDEAEDIEGFERALGKGADLTPPDPEAGDQILFIPITKINAAQREVWGRAAQEVRDHADEIMDYASSKPLFNAWVEDTFKRSGGKSKGNIRAMHGPIAAGKVTEFQFNDPEKAFDIGTKIVDDNEWQKCLEGVYTGFSIGGKYAKRWYDNGLTRYTAQPREISLVDAPAIPTATFKLVKEDGSEELHKFAHYLDSAAGDALDKALPAMPSPTRQTVVETQVSTMPALNATLQVTQADQANPNLGSAAFAQAANPNAGAIEPQVTAIVAEVPKGDPNTGPAISEMTAGGAAKKELTIEDVQKAVQDIPNLRHIQEGDPVSCGNCLHKRIFDDWQNIYCRKFDSCVRQDWVCDAWDKEGAHPDQTLIPLSENEPSARVEMAKPGTEPEEAAKVVDVTEDSIRIRQKDPADFQEGSFRTITISAKDGIKAVIGKLKGETSTTIQTYIFDKNKFDQAKAKAWVADHKPNAKKMIEVIELGERIGLVKRTDALPDADDWSAATARYADPINQAYDCGERVAALISIARYNRSIHKSEYSPRERAVLGRRIARLAGAVTGAIYKFDPKAKRIERTDKEKSKMDKTVSDMLTQARSLIAAGTPEALEQASAIMDVAIDTVSAPSAINPQTTATPTSMPTEAKADGKPASSPSSPSSPSGDTKTPEPSVPTTPTTPTPPAKKVEEPTAMTQDPVFNSQPPQMFNVGVGGESYVKARMPEFVGIMERTDDVNRLQKAFDQIAQKDQYAFDDLWNASCYELAKAAGFTYDNIGKLMAIGPTTFGAGISGRGPSVDLAKAFNATTAPGVYLRRLLALMLPVMNPWRMRVNTSNPTTGSDKAIWRMILGFQSTVLAMAMRSPEAGTSIGSTTGSGVPVDETPTTFTASYQSIKLNNAVTGKSLYTMRGYDDPITVALLETLTGTLRVEEMQNLIGNFAAIAKPTSATTTPVTGGTPAGTVPASNYIVRVTSLTGQGWRLTQEIPSYLGSGTYTINGTSQATVGESDPTSATVQTLGSTGRLDVTWPSVAGAAAYNVYVRDDTGNTEHWYATVTAPKVSILSYPSTGNSGAAVPDTTANTLGFEGVSRWSVLSTVYSQTIPQKSSVVVDAAGAALTLVAPNSISQLDSVIQQQFTKWHIAPTLLIMSPGTTNHLTAKVGSATNPPQLIVIQQGPAQGQVVGGLAATGYINRFSPWLSNAPSVIPILAHPYLPDGQINVVCESIPYPNAREGRGWTLETLRPYTYWPIAPLTDAYPFMIVADELLECNHPSAQGQIYGIDIT